MSAPLTTLEDLASVRGVDADPTDLQAVIALETASAMVRSSLGQLLEDTVDDEITLDGTGTDAILLPELPVNVVTLVSTVSGDTTTELTETTDYIVGAGGILWRTTGSVWPQGRQNVLVTYDHGWVLPGQDLVDGSSASLLPADIQGVTRDLALALLNVATLSGAGQMTSASLGAASFTWAAGTQNETKNILDRLDKFRTPVLR